MERRSMKRRVVGVASVLFSLIGMAVVACSRVRTPDVDAVQHVSDLPCPLPDTRENALVGKLGEIPEYHDCQKLATGNPAAYGPLVGIFVTRGFAIRDSLDRRPDSTDRDAAPRAIIRNFGTSVYSAGLLNFRPGFSCVWLTYEGGSWSATIAFAGPKPTCSKEDADPRESVTLPATLAERAPEPLGDRDYPRVARWQWDPAAHHHYFGIKCGVNWCQFGGSGEVQPTLSDVPEFTPITVTGGGPDHPHRIKEVMGWYDQQQLAEEVKSGTTTLLQPTVLARVFPHPQLEQVSLSMLGAWVQSAFVYMDGSSSKYGRALNLGQGYSEIALCQGGSCPGLPPATAQECKVSDGDSKGESARKWYARIRPVSGATEGNTRYRCVIKQQHPGFDIPGTARWRWADDDEKIWIRCTNGCCTVV